LQPEVLADIREALSERRWSDAVFRWADATGTPVDAYPDEEITPPLDDEAADLEIRLAPILEDGP